MPQNTRPSPLRLLAASVASLAALGSISIAAAQESGPTLLTVDPSVVSPVSSVPEDLAFADEEAVSPTTTAPPSPTALPTAVPAPSSTQSASSPDAALAGGLGADDLPADVPQPDNSASATPGATRTPTPSSVPSPTVAPTPTPPPVGPGGTNPSPPSTPTAVPTPKPGVTTTPTNTPAPQPTATAGPQTTTPTASPTATVRPQPTATPNVGQPTSTPTATPSAQPTATPTPRPSATPTPRPTPTAQPTATPTPQPTPTATPTPQPTATPTPPPSGWSMVWNDEFNSGSLDSSKWVVEHSTYGDGGGTIHCYTPNNVTVSGGDLVLTAKDESITCPNGSTRDWSSGMVRTQGKADWLYGRVEVRAKLPAGQGMWPAAWLSPTDGAYGGWPSSGELDIVELLGHDPDTIVGTVHWGASGDHKHHGAYSHSSTPFTDGYHEYAIEWEPGEIRWFIDDVHYHTSTPANGWYAPGTSNANAPFDQAFYLKLNLAVGGYWPGNPDGSTPAQTEMRIDYVRVYQ